MVSLSPQKTNEQQQHQQHSPTPTVSSTAAVASTTSSSDGAILSNADRISATILAAGDDDDDDVKEVLLPHLKNEDVALSVRQRIALAMDEIEKEDNEEKHLSSLPSPPSSSPPTPSPSSACSSVNWEVLEKLLGGGGGDGSINGDDGCKSVNDEEGRRTEDGRKDAKSKIRLLAELVGSKALTTCTSDEGVAKRYEKEKSKNATNRVTKLPRRSKEGTTSKQGQTKELRPKSLLGPRIVC